MYWSCTLSEEQMREACAIGCERRIQSIKREVKSYGVPFGSHWQFDNTGALGERGANVVFPDLPWTQSVNAFGKTDFIMPFGPKEGEPIELRTREGMNTDLILHEKEDGSKGDRWFILIQLWNDKVRIVGMVRGATVMCNFWKVPPDHPMMKARPDSPCWFFPFEILAEHEYDVRRILGLGFPPPTDERLDCVGWTTKYPNPKVAMEDAKWRAWRKRKIEIFKNEIETFKKNNGF